MGFSNYFANVLCMCVCIIELVAADRLCDRIFFKLPSEDYFPYYGVEGVYKRTSQKIGNVPVFEHEQGGIYFQYVYASKKLFFGRSIGTKNYIGLSADVWSSSFSWDWIKKIKDAKRPFKYAVRRWNIYDPLIEKHRIWYRGGIEAICVDDHTFLCTSRRVFINTTLTDGSKVSHDMKTDYFSELENIYSHDRPVYKHSKTTKFYLFYADHHWIIGPDYKQARGFIKVKTAVRRPEYVTTNWEIFNGRRWEFFKYTVSIRCKGVKSSATGDICSPGKSPCPTGTPCYRNTLNETVCKCGVGRRGPLCASPLGRCSTYRLNTIREIMAVSQQGYDGDSLVIFCKKYKRPAFLVGICTKGGIGYSYEWRKNGTCLTVATTRKPYPTSSRKPGSTSSSKNKAFNADDYIWIEPVVLSLAIVLQIVTPVFFICCDVSFFRATSMFLFFSMLWWAAYLFGCLGTKCGAYGRVFADLIIMALVMLIVGYLFHIIEACYSTEREYVSMVVQDTSLRAYLDILKNNKVTITGSVECYHMETRTRTVYYTDANGNTQTRIETYQEMVVTYTESQVFEYNFCVDVSPVDLPPLNVEKVTRLKIVKEVIGGDEETTQALSNFRDDLIDRNKHRDVHIAYHQNEEIPNYREHVCAYLDRVEKPWWMNSGCYWLATILCMTWPYRWFFQLRTGKSQYILRKAVYVHEPPQMSLVTPASAPQLQSGYNEPVVNQPISVPAYPLMYVQTPIEPPPSYETATGQGAPFQYYNPTISNSSDNLVR